MQSKRNQDWVYYSAFTICAYFEPYCYKNKVIIDYITEEILEYNLYSTPQHNFQRIRLFYNGHLNIDFSQYICSEMQYQKSYDSAIITNRLADKGIALEALIQYYGYEKDDILSFGDNINDIPMLMASGTGVAMGNAVSPVKDIADYITLSNNDDGVADYLETFILQGE